MTVDIPLHPLSWKILHTIFLTEDNAIRIPPADIHHQLILYQRKKYRGNIEKLSRILTTYAPIHVPTKNIASIKRSKAQVGYHILTYHFELLHYYIYAQKKAGVPASIAIDNFYAEYHITEDDYSRESAYKRWQRFQEKKSKQNYFKKKHTNCPKDIIPVPTTNEINVHVGEMVVMYTPHFLDHAGKWSNNIIRDLHIYMLHKFQVMNIQQLAEEFQCTTRNINRIIHKSRETIALYGLEHTPYIRNQAIAQ